MRLRDEPKRHFRRLRLRENERRRRHRSLRLLAATPTQFDLLEPRILLTTTASFDSAAGVVTFDSDEQVSITLRSQNDLLEWSDDDGSTFSSDLHSATPGDQQFDFTTAAGTTLEIVDDDNSILGIILSNLSTLGGSLVVDASNISIASDATVSAESASADAGDVTFKAPNIDLESGSQLLAESNGTDAAGAVTLEAIQITNQTPNVSSRITLTDATIRGGNVDIEARAEVESLSGVDALLSSFGIEADLLIDGLTLIGNAIDPDATAEVTMSGGAIFADNLSIDAHAETDADVTVITVFIGVGYARTTATAEVNIGDAALIDVANDVSINSFAGMIDMTVNATQFSGGLTSINIEKVNSAIAIGVAEITAKTTLSSDSTIMAGGKVDFVASGLKDMDVTTTAAAGRTGVVGFALSISDIISNIEALADGTIIAGDDISILADFVSTQNDTTANAIVGEGNVQQSIKRGAAGGLSFLLGILGPLGSLISGPLSNVGRNKTDSTSNTTGLSAGIAIAVQKNTVIARVGDGAKAESTGGDIQIVASSADLPQVAAQSDVESDAAAKNTRKRGFSAAFSYGSFTNDADAYIGRGADIDVSGDLLVNSETRVPWEQQWWKWDNLVQSIVDKLNFNFGVQNGLFTSWAEAYAAGAKFAFGGSVNILEIDNHSDAFIDETADVSVGGQTSVLAINENDTVNFGGQFLFILTGTQSSGSGVGGSVVYVDYENHTNARIKSDAIVDSGSLLVMAGTDERNISIVTQGGKADGDFAFNGAANVLLIDNFTRAQIDDGASVTVGSQFVDVPRDFDTVTIDSNSLFSDVPQFNPLEILDEETGAQRIDASQRTIELPYDHGLTTGQAVRYLDNGGTEIGGLTDGGQYYVRMIDDSTVKLAATPTDAAAGTNLIPVSLSGTEGFAHTLYPGFVPANAIAADGETVIDLGFEHDLLAGQTLAYFNPEGQAIPELTDGELYFIKEAGDTTVTLSTTEDGPALTLTPSAATGGAHFLVSGTAVSDQVTTSIDSSTLKVSNPLHALDSDQDGKVETSDEHIRAITDDAYLTDLSLLVLADDHAGLYNGVGGFTKGRSVGIGIAIGVSQIERETLAMVGNIERGLGTALGAAPSIGLDSADEFFLGYDHGFADGDEVTYTSGGDFDIDGLLDGETYFAETVADSDSSGDPTIRLGRSALEAARDTSTVFAPSNVDSADDVIDLGYTHGFQLGDRIVYDSGGGAGDAIGGLVDGEEYWVIPVSATEIALAQSLNLATAGFHTVFDPLDTVDDSDQLVFSYDPGFETGDVLLYGHGGATAIDDLADGQLVSITKDDPDLFAYTLQDDIGDDIALDAASSSGRVHTLQPTFDSTTDDVDAAADEIDLGFVHGLQTGDAVRYESLGTGEIAGLTDGDRYFAVPTGAQTLALAASENDADRARWRFFETETAIADVTDGIDTSSVIDFWLPHPYEDNDGLTYTTQAYYDDPTVETISPLQYIDPTNGTLQTLAEGQTLYAIRDLAVDTADVETLADVTVHTGLRLALAEDGPAIQLLTNLAAGVHGFRIDDARVDIGLAGAAGVHTLRPDARTDLDGATGSTTTDHSVRLSLDPDGTFLDTHAIGLAFDPSGAIADDEIDLGFDHGFETGDRVIYSNGRGESIAGLGHGNVYYVVRTGAQKVQLAESRARATAADPEIIEITDDAVTGATHGFGRAFDPQPIIDSNLDTISFRRSHGFQDGDRVIYTLPDEDGDGTADGTAIGGLEPDTEYDVDAVDSTTLRLKDVDTGNVIDLDGTVGDSGNLGELVGTGGVVDVLGDGQIISNNNGQIISVSLAGTAVSETKSAGNTSGTQENADGDDSPEHSWAVSASIAVNIVDDVTKAYIQNTDFSAADLDLGAFNVSQIGTGSGALAFSSSTDDAVGIAGAVSVNVIDNETTTFIENAKVTIDAGDLDVEAENDTSIIGVALGLSGVSGAFSLAGSVVVNVISANAQALIRDDADIFVNAAPGDDTTGNLNLLATDTNAIIAAAGSISFLSGRSGRSTGIGAAVVVNVIDNTAGTNAIISDSDVDADGAIVVDATLDNQIDTVAAAVAFSSGTLSQKTVAIAISVSVNVIATPTRASIRRKKANGVKAGRGVSITADDNSDIVSVAGNAAFAFGEGGNANGVAVGVNVIDNRVIASTVNAPITAESGDLRLTADSTPTITSVAAGGSVSSGAARQGSFSINVLDNETKAFISGTQTVTADGNVAVTAADRLDLVTIAGSVVFAGKSGGGPLSAFGLSNSTIVTDNIVEAYIGDNVTVQAGANGEDITISIAEIDGDGNRQTVDTQGVAVTAHSSDNITTVAAGGTFAGEPAAFAGSATVTILSETTRAYIGAGAQINNLAMGSEDTDQDVWVQAAERTDLDGIAGAASVSLKSRGVGAGVDVAIINKDTEAYIGGGAAVEATDSVRVDAFSEEDILSAAAAFAAGKSQGVAGGVGVGVSVYTIDTRAYIGALANVSANDNVRVSAEERTLLEIINGALSFGVNGALAGGIGVPIFTKTTEAYIGDGAMVEGRGLGSGITVDSGDFLAFTGDTSQSGMIQDTDLDNSDIPVLDDPSYVNDRNATPDTITGFRGVAVTAVNSDQVEMYNIGAGGSAGSAAIAVALGLNVVVETTRAYIDDHALVNQDRDGAGDGQSVLVTAGNDFFTRAIGGALAGSGSSAATPGLELALLEMDTQAWIGQNARVSASDDVTVTAFNEEDIIAVAVSIAGGGTIAGAGAVAVLDLDNKTHAYIEDGDDSSSGATVFAGGNLRLHAEDRSDVDLIAGGAAGGISAGGIGISLGIALIDKSTQAWVGDHAIVDAKAGDGTNTFAIFNGDESGGNAQTSDIVGVGISAFSEEDLFNLAVAGAAGLGFAVAGSVTIDQFNSDTKAFTSSSATINVRDDTDADPDQDVYVTAVNKLSATAIVGSIAGTLGGGVGAGVDVGSIGNETEARLGGTVSARRDVRVAATSDREIFSVGVAGTVGTVGLSGGISFWTIGQDVDGTYVVDNRSANTLSNDRDFNDATEESVNDSNGTDMEYDSSDSPNRGDNSNEVADKSNGVLDVFKSFTDALVDSTMSYTEATIDGGADVKAGRDVVVKAREEFFSTQTAGGIALTLVGAGAGLSQVLHASETKALIKSGAEVDVGRHLTVDASSFEDMRILSIAGSGAIIGFAAGYAEASAMSDQVAGVGLDANIKNAQTVSVTADQVRRFDVVSGGGSVGTIAAGLAATQVTAGGTVLAAVDDGTLLGEIDEDTLLVTDTVGPVAVNATSTVEGIQGQSQARAEATAVAGGIFLAGAGAFSRIVIEPDVVATIDVGAEVYSSGAVDVTARTDMDAIAETFGIQGGSITVGLSSATARIEPLVNAVIATDSIVEGTAITVQALHNFSADGSAIGGKAKSKSFSASGSLVGLLGATADARSSATVRIDVSDDSAMTATAGDIVLESRSNNDADSEASGRAFGIVGIGFNSATATVDTDNQIIVLSRASIEAREGNITLSADSTENALSDSTAGDGAAFAFSTTESTTDIDNVTRVSVGSGAHIEAEQTLTLETDSTTVADADAEAENVGLETDTDGTGTVRIDIVVDTAISGATLVGKDVVMRSTVTSVDARAFGRGNSEFALDTDAFGSASISSNVASTIGVGGSARIEGLDSVTLVAEQLEMITESFADANADSLGGTATASSTTLQTTDTSVTAGGSATIITQTLDVQANAPSAPYASAGSAADGAVIGDESSPTIDAIRLRRDISFDATVIIVSPSPVLEVGSNDEVLDVKILTFDDGGSIPDVVEGTIEIDDIINTSSADGAISFSVSSASIEEVFESNESDDQRDEIESTITGMPAIILQTGFFRVTIKNRSDFELVLNKMDVVNEAADPEAAVSVSDADDASIDLSDVTKTPGATRIEIDNRKLVTFEGAIENHHGITEVVSHDQDIVSSGSGVIQSGELILSALDGEIGNGSTDRLATKSSDVTLSTRLTATALNDIHIGQAGVPDEDGEGNPITVGGDIGITSIRSLTGLVDLQANGSILDESTEDIDADVRATHILLDSLAAAIGDASNSLEVDATSATEAIRADAATGLYLTEIAGGLNIATVSGGAGIRTTDSPGDIVLVARDDDGGGERLELLDGQAIQSDEGSITLNIGDDVKLPEGASLDAGASLAILVDQEPFDVGVGSIVDLLGTLGTGTAAGDTFTITGGDDPDTINITHLCGAPTFVLTGADNDEINIASALNRLDLILDPIHVDGGADGIDVLNLNASGFMFTLVLDLAADLDGAVLPQELLDAFAASAKPLTAATPTATVLLPGARWRINDDDTTFLAIVENNAINVYDEGNAEDTTGSIDASTMTGFEAVVTGFGMGTNGAVHHANLEFLNLDLGTAGDTVTVSATADATVTTVTSGAGDDTFTVGGAVNVGVGDVDGTLVLDGGSDDDDLEIDDTQNASGRTGAAGGVLEEFRLSGLGMGDATEGVFFGSFEDLDLNLGSGADELTVQGLNTDAIVRLGDGGGTVRLGAGDPTDGIEDDLARLAADLVLNGSDMAQDDLVVNASLSANITVDIGSLDIVGAPGEVTFTEFDSLDVNLGTAGDRVRIVDTSIMLDVETGVGADIVSVEGISAITDIDLGDDADGDLVTVFGADAALDISGSGNGFDEVFVDQSARTDAIEPGALGIDPPTIGDHPTDPDTGVLSHVTTGAVTFSAITRFGLTLGSGNDRLAIDLGHNLSTTVPTIVNVDAGGGNDTVNVSDLESETIVAGGDQNDTVNVVIDGFPTADQFANLSLDVENLVVDNTKKAGADNTDSVAWSLVDDILGADVVAANLPSPLPPVTPFEIMDASGAEIVRILGGITDLDTLDVGTETFNEVDGEIDRPLEDGVPVNRVTLEYGAVVVEPDAAATFRQP